MPSYPLKACVFDAHNNRFIAFVQVECCYFFGITVFVSAKFNVAIHIKDKYFNSISDLCSI